MISQTILIVEDDISVRKLLEITFDQYGYNYISTDNITNAIINFKTHNIGLIILDLGLPDGDGKELIPIIREVSKVPIIIVSARYDENNIITALDSGADDYIKKPFSISELLARIRAVFRRKNTQENILDNIICSDLELDNENHVIYFKKEYLKLTPIEYELLKYFIINANKTLTHRQILKEVWGIGYQNEMQYLRSYVNILRKKIEENRTKPSYIKTESGIGYRFCCGNKEL
ncbi:MAG: response regulator [Arcobacteraceae bacterium]|jgi:two-component system KDP operon response regulator KdpE|nr:response regulator [Arcobacteraceae bacterium]MDY0327486.1 response regulator [Arcobacteraceae bacterium]